MVQYSHDVLKEKISELFNKNSNCNREFVFFWWMTKEEYETMTENMNRFKEGDIIISENVEREIVKAFKKSYIWKYPDINTVFNSLNSNDPLFEMGGWKIKENETTKSI